jgi:hypothetical protein
VLFLFPKNKRGLKTSNFHLAPALVLGNGSGSVPVFSSEGVSQSNIAILGDVECWLEGKKMVAAIPFPCSDPFGIPFPVARDRASVGRRYQ